MGRGFARALNSIVVLVLLCHPWPSSAEPLADFPVALVTIEPQGRAGSPHAFKAWLADTAPRHEQGLMFVRKLAADRGMLFVFTPPQVVSFWMKNTYLSLDILFIAPDGRITRIAEHAKPLSTDSIASLGVAALVLELNAGTARRLRLEPGDRLTYRPAETSH
jgi:uncharacterized membrane protein (UPF0127 family)